MIRVFFFLLTVGLAVHVSGRQRFDSLLAAADHAASDSLRLDIYQELYDYYRYSHPDTLEVCLYDALRRFEKDGYEYGQGFVISLIGSINGNHGRVVLGARQQRRALTIFRKLNNARGLTRVNNELGILEARSGNFDVAAEHFHKALSLAEKDHNAIGIANGYMNLGLIYDEHEDLNKALGYYQKALGELEDTTDIRTLCILYNNIAISYGKQGKLDTSLRYLQSALLHSNKDDFIDIYLYSLLNMGILYEHYDRKDKALKFYNEAILIARDKQLPEEEAHLLINKALLFLPDSVDKSITLLNEAIAIARTLGQKIILRTAYENLSECYKVKGDYRQVVAVMEEAHEVQDSLFNIEKVRDLANIENAFELEQSENEVMRLRLAEQGHKLNRDVLAIVAAGLVVILVVVVFGNYRARRLNERLKKQSDDLAATNAIKDKLLSIIGHDLRGPVGNFPVVLEIIEDESTPDTEKKQIIESLKEQNQSTLDTLDMLLLWGKSQLKGTSVNKENFDAAVFVRKNISLLQVAATQKRITISNSVPSVVFVSGDANHFDFVIRNLLSNAVKFTPAGGEVHVGADVGQPDGFVVFSVSDTGLGIRDDMKERIFQPFSESAKGTAGEGGTAMGLMLCREFVQLNGGDIDVDSEYGKGSTFYFTFPEAKSLPYIT